VKVPIHVRVRLGELDSGAGLGYISPHTHARTRNFARTFQYPEREPGSGPPTHLRANSEPAVSRAKLDSAEPGSWRPTHRRVWLIGTRAEPSQTRTCMGTLTCDVLSPSLCKTFRRHCMSSSPCRNQSAACCGSPPLPTAAFTPSKHRTRLPPLPVTWHFLLVCRNASLFCLFLIS
jgi:hypothetical protein